MKTISKNKFKFSRPTATVAAAILAMLCLASSGCSTFNRDWKRVGTAARPSGVEGRWEGTWTSDANGHSGALRCLLEKVSEEKYRARFDSTYKKVLHFKSTVLLHGTNDVAGIRFDGEAKLPWWAGGIYRYEGKATATNFFSTYNNKYDHGTFQMIRPE